MGHTLGSYSVWGKKKILSFTEAWLDLDNIMLYEIHKAQEDK